METTENLNHNIVFYSTAKLVITYSFEKLKSKFIAPYRVQPEDEVVNNFQDLFNTKTNSKVGL